jgi:hypothetical protein
MYKVFDYDKIFCPDHIDHSLERKVTTLCRLLLTVSLGLRMMCFIVSLIQKEKKEINSPFFVAMIKYMVLGLLLLL